MKELEGSNGESNETNGIEHKKENGLDIYSAKHVAMVPEVGFVETGETAVVLGTEENILNSLRVMGLSEDAIAAFKSGRAVSVVQKNTPFGISSEEHWIGKSDSER